MIYVTWISAPAGEDGNRPVFIAQYEYDEYTLRITFQTEKDDDGIWVPKYSSIEGDDLVALDEFVKYVFGESVEPEDRKYISRALVSVLYHYKFDPIEFSRNWHRHALTERQVIDIAYQFLHDEVFGKGDF